MATQAKSDLGGIFASDDHRRVLGHLSHPDDDYGWTQEALPWRIGEPVEDLDAILADLEEAGHAAKYGDAWRMTQEGCDALTGPVADEPGEPGPALIKALQSRVGASTRIEVTT